MTKKILLIGGTHGISEALQKRLEKAGNDVVTAARGSEATVSCDMVENPQEVEGSFDGLVYCPGTVNLKPFKQLTDSDFQNDWEINFLGAVHVIQKMLDHLNEGASIVLFSTVAVQLGLPFHVSIAAAKGAVEGLVRSLAAELAPKIRVNAVAPSLTETPLTENLIDTESKRDTSAKRHPLGRFGTPDDPAAAVEFLLSDNASWITGQILGVDGGLSSIRLL